METGEIEKTKGLNFADVLRDSGLELIAKSESYNRKMVEALDRDLDHYSLQTEKLQKRVKRLEKLVKKLTKKAKKG